MPKAALPPEISALLAQGMGPELHWFPEKVSPTALAETMAGMANTQGGLILFGISPRFAQIQGVVDIPGLLDVIFQAALLPDPPLVLPIPEREVLGQSQVVRLQIPAGLPHVYSMSGRYLGREGWHTGPIGARRLRQLLLERGIVHFESQVHPSAHLSDLDEKQVEYYVNLLNLPGEATWEEVLLRRGCLKILPERNEPAPTYAALLLFGRHPQQWLPSADILATRFTGSTFNDTFIKQEITGTLPQQLRKAEQFLRDNMQSAVKIDGLTHQEVPTYPSEAVRELLVNACAHRDYNIQGDSIHLHIFSDRLEVHSPGRLPGPVNLKNLLEARFSRNPVIVQVLSDLGFVERLGYGLDRVVNVMDQQQLPPPNFEEIAGTFRVTLRGAGRETLKSFDFSRYESLNLNHRQKTVLRFLGGAERITNRVYQELCPDVSTETLRRDLSDLVGKGVLIKIGDRRATYYILKST